MKKITKVDGLKLLTKRNILWIVFIGIFILHIFLRFYQLEQRMGFNWDQLDNAWAAKSILIDHQYPLLGMVAKASSGFYIGPAYYYLVALFYWLFHLNPIASPILAGCTSIITFLVFFFLTKKLFPFQVALMVVYIDTVSYFVILSDRSQWPVDFIAPFSLAIFYSLYQVISGKIKYILLLALLVGLSFHVHFTSVFYPLIIFLSLPFFPRKKETLLYIAVGILLFLLLLSPIFVAEMRSSNTHVNNALAYLNIYNHGFHLTRFFQLTHDAFIEPTLILPSWFGELSPLLLFFFIILYYRESPSKQRRNFCYLFFIWFFVPWIIFSLYSGEITNYYFALTRPLALIAFSYLTYRLITHNNILFKGAITIFWIYFTFINLISFFSEDRSDFLDKKQKVLADIQDNKIYKPHENIPESYLYYYYTQQKPIKKK